MAARMARHQRLADCPADGGGFGLGLKVPSALEPVASQVSGADGPLSQPSNQAWGRDVVIIQFSICADSGVVRCHATAVPVAGALSINRGAATGRKERRG